MKDRAIQNFRDSLNTSSLDNLILNLKAQPSRSQPAYSKKVVALLTYFRHIEALVMVEYAKSIRLMPSYFNLAIREFSDQWEKEEARHAVAIEELLRIHGHDVAPIDKTSGGWRNWFIVHVTIILSWIFWFVSPGLHMIVGLLNEATTKSGYWALMKQIDDKELRHVIAVIQAEEMRHLQFYSEMTSELLGRPWKKWWAEKLLSLAWVPVGANNADAKSFAQKLLKDQGIRNGFLSQMKSRLTEVEEIIPNISSRVIGDIMVLVD